MFGIIISFLINILAIIFLITVIIALLIGSITLVKFFIEAVLDWYEYEERMVYFQWQTSLP